MSRVRSPMLVSGCLRSRLLSIRVAGSVAVASLRLSISALRSSDGLFSLAALSVRVPFVSALRAEPPARSFAERSAAAFSLVVVETDGVFRLMKSPICVRDSPAPVRDSLLEMRGAMEAPCCESEVSAWPPGATPDFATVGADGLVLSTEVPRCWPGFVLVSLESPADLVTEGVRAVMESPIRDVMLRLIRPLEPAVESLLEFETEGVGAVTGSVV